MPTSTPSPPSKPAPEAAKPAVDDDAPVKFKRPLAQPGDKDYVTGQPTTEEEAAKIEKEEADRHAAVKAARDKAEHDKAEREKAAHPKGS